MICAGAGGGGPNEWQTVGPYGSCTITLPPNTLWQLDCRLQGSQLISSIQAASGAEIELNIVGSRVRAELADHQPIQY